MSALLVITPAHDEAARIEAVAEAVDRQKRRPDLWVVVDDGSSDETFEIASAIAASLPFMRVVRAPRSPSPPPVDGLAVASEARAFKWALAEFDDPRFGFIGKLDADIVLAPDHYRRLLSEFERDPSLGIAGCYLEQVEGGRRDVAKMPAYHVNGAVKLYRRDCFEQIGGIEPRLAWDTIDETHARMLGWRTHSFIDLRAQHLRPSGSAAGILRGRARHGECVWIAGYPPALVLARGARLATDSPPLLGGLAFAGGWLRAAMARRPRIEDPDLLAFSRDEQRRRIRRAVRAAVARRVTT